MPANYVSALLPLVMLRRKECCKEGAEHYVCRGAHALQGSV